MSKSEEMRQGCELKDGRVSITFNDIENPVYERFFRMHLERGYPIGGTWFPGIETMENAQSVLLEEIFDERPEIIVEGNLQIIPYEEGVIY